MCLSTAYKTSIAPENVLMKNVVSIEYVNGRILLTDLMERKLSIEGDLKIAQLTDGYLIVEPKEDHGERR